MDTKRFGELNENQFHMFWMQSSDHFSLISLGVKKQVDKIATKVIFQVMGLSCTFQQNFGD